MSHETIYKSCTLCRHQQHHVSMLLYMACLSTAESEPFILFTKRAIIHGVGLDGSGLTDVVSTNQGNVLGLDFDYR